MLAKLIINKNSSVMLQQVNHDGGVFCWLQTSETVFIKVGTAGQYILNKPPAV